MGRVFAPGFFRWDMLQFDLSPLIGARPGERLTFSLDEGPQGLDDIRIAYLRGRIDFTRIQGGILVEAQLETESEAQCIRCLEPFALPLTLEVEEIIGLAGRLRPGVTFQIDEEGTFDPFPLLREQIWVVMPMKPLCRTECRGICPTCGANLNSDPCDCRRERIDPRLALLETLKQPEGQN